VLFFAASESTASDNLLSLSRLIGGRSSAPVFTDYDSALAEIFDNGENERLIFVIDEFPYLAGAYRGISSLLQIMIDHRKDTSKLMLILCGSSMSFMESQVLGHQSPLYGRRTAQLKILPFTFFESMPFFENYESEDKAVLYGLTGGIPEYLSKIDNKMSIRENIINLFLTSTGHFFEEPSNLIKQELREPATYNVIIEAIASGASRLNEISTRCNLESNKCAKYLRSLIALGLVGKEYPYGEKVSKRSIYKIEDLMFKFWYRFVFPNMSAVVAGLGEAVYENEIRGQQLSTYMGFVFEDICKQWFFMQARKYIGFNYSSGLEEIPCDAPPFFIGSIGRWWGTNPKTRTQEEVDIMATHKNSALFAECKWKNGVDIDVLRDIKRKSEIFSYSNVHLYIFMKNTATTRLYEEAAKEKVKLYSLDEIILMGSAVAES
jgi:AAA+ ATPase superfamily predicted ATPase